MKKVLHQQLCLLRFIGGGFNEIKASLASSQNSGHTLKSSFGIGFNIQEVLLKLINNLLKILLSLLILKFMGD